MKKLFSFLCLWLSALMLNATETLPKVRAYFVKNGEAKLEASCKVSKVEDGLFGVQASLENLGDAPAHCKLVIESITDFVPTNYVIPSVMYNANEFGGRSIPHGLTYKGEPWIFAYDRSSIPACSVSEDAKNVFALFASEKDAKSLTSSSSVEKLPDGRFAHRIFYPVTEAPVSYTAKKKFTERYDTWLTLAPKEKFEVSAYIVRDVPSIPNYGFAKVFDRAWKIFKHDIPCVLTKDEVWKYGISFISSLKTRDENGREWVDGEYADANHAVANNLKRKGIEGLTLAAMEKNPKLNFYFPKKKYSSGTSIGFSSQAFMSARLLIADALRRNNAEDLRFAVNIFYNWIDLRQTANGLILKKDEKGSDCCHQGWGIIELARTSQLLKTNGMQKESAKLLASAKKLANFFIENYDEEFGFGKTWSREGKMLDKTGSLGGFVLLGLVELWKAEKDPKVRQCIDKALDLYYTRDLDKFVCNAGAIDCLCVDKESAYPFLESAVEMYEATKDKKYLDRAVKAAYYICSWVFIYDALYPPEAEFSKIGYHTAGGTAISAEHHALDPYAGVMVNNFLKLTKFTGDQKWADIGRLLWRNAIQAISTPDNRIWHEIERPIGGQNEGFFQTRWTKYRTDCNMRGHLNDYLGAWLSTFRLSTLLVVPESEEL